ncbi:LytR C-terminal domain-containing protein [Blastococcus sp. TF02-09]|uniref:LytR C-terminal domain-containing protein n=1 Tax=Blastococcus sp. TF02-09 TaxID=2250576 RepID=UPI0011BDB325|nr:LytR C-terminal domain-containing protein [Blastococcus sp. TF02-9]
MSRARLPLPPVPVSSRPSAPLEERAGALAESLRAAEAAAARRKSVWVDDDAAPASTGPTGIGSGAPAPRLPRQAGGSSDARYGDWTKPSRSGELPSEEEMRAALAPVPATSLIPERSVAQRDEDIPDLDEETPARPARGSSRAAVGGRAALRAERQAADDARRRAAKENGITLLDDEPRRAPRRVAKGLVAMGVVALGVLGVYQVTSPKTDEAAASTRTTPATTSVAPVTPLPPLPELDTGAETVPVEEVAPSAPVRVPLAVLNATDVTGLAAKISGVVVGGGWEAAGVGAYNGDDVPATTVYYTEGDETQRQAALQLVEQFPQLQGPAPRFFELPAEVDASSLVIVAAGEWVP